MVRREGYIDITIKLAKDGGQWAAECVELGTAACGGTFEEAVEAIKDLIQLHLNTLEDVGMRRRFFREHGITFHRRRPAKFDPRSVPTRPGETVQRMIQPLKVAVG